MEIPLEIVAILKRAFTAADQFEFFSSCLAVRENYLEQCTLKGTCLDASALMGRLHEPGWLSSRACYK